MRFVILHYHILKNAGSTIEDILDQSFGERFARFDHAERDATIFATELLAFVERQPGLSAVSSHQIRYPLPESANFLFYDICFLRDPVDRVRSMYDYYRKRPDAGDPVSDLANDTDLGGFVAGMVRDYPLQINNVQVNLIAAAGDSEDLTAADLELASERMLHASFPGVVDIFDESVAAGGHFLRQVFPELNCSMPPVNVSGRSGGSVESRTDPDVFQQLVRLNTLDFELVARTRVEVRRRLALIQARKPKPRASYETLFDRAWYLRTNPDVAAAGWDAWRHYMKHGAAEGRKPHPWFQPDYYRKQGPDAVNPHRLFNAAEATEPLEQYLKKAAVAGAGIVIDDVLLPFAAIENPPAHLRAFLQATNSDQIHAHMRLQRGKVG